jgi:hypothetical protein
MHLCGCVSEGGGEGADSESSSLLFREPIHLCGCVSEGAGEGAGSEAPSLLSYTRRYVAVT